jgi:hypothetical protein
MIYNIEHNNDVVTLQIPVTNNDLTTNATGVVATQLFPTGISIYGTPTVTKGSYNTTTKIWTIGTLNPQETANLTLKVKVDDIDVQPFTIKTTITLNEGESNTSNNIRFDVLKLGSCTDCDLCDPCNFVEPTIVLYNDVAGLVVNLAANDTINCTCCQKTFEIVGTPDNIIVNSLSNIGILKYTYIDSKLPGSLQYRVVCANCPNGLDYTSDPATVTFDPLVVSLTNGYVVKPTQTVNYTQEINFDYFRFDNHANNITFTLLPVTSWSIGRSVKIYVYDSTQSGPLAHTFTVSLNTGTFTEGGTTKTITANYSSLEIVYIGGNKFDII